MQELIFNTGIQNAVMRECRNEFSFCVFASSRLKFFAISLFAIYFFFIPA